MTVGDLWVRAARVEDAPSIGEAHAESWRVAYAGLFSAEFLKQAVEERRGRKASELVTMLVADDEPTLSDGSTLLVVEMRGAVVGYVHGGDCPADPRTQEIYGFYVHPHSWGTGAAQAMWNETLARLSTRSDAPMMLWTLEGATRARRFYERNGWVWSGQIQLRDLGDGNQSRLVQYRSP